MDMRIDRKGRLRECLRHDDAGSLVTDTGKFLELLDVARNFTLIDNCFCHLFESPRLPWSESAASNQFHYFLFRHLRKRSRSRSTAKERGRDAIDLSVRSLRRQNH